MVRRVIGMVPQEYTADEDLTGYENIILCADLYGIPREVAKKRTLELLNLVELTSFKDKRVETYSGGMRRRLELAYGLINRPKVLFLDEPTLGLDVQTRAAIWEYVRRLKNEYDMTLFMTTHYLEEADALCDCVAIIDHGKIVVMGTPSELKDSLGGDIITIAIKENIDVIELIHSLENVKEVKWENGVYRIKADHGEITVEGLRRLRKRRGEWGKKSRKKVNRIPYGFFMHGLKCLAEREGVAVKEFKPNYTSRTRCERIGRETGGTT